MSAATMADIAKEVKDSADFLAARTASGGGEDAAAKTKELGNNMITAICAKVGALKHFTAHEAMMLDKTLVDSVLPQELRRLLQDAADNRLTSGIAASHQTRASPGGGGLKSQAAPMPQNYPTAEEWVKLLAPDATVNRFLYTVHERLRRCGLRSANERTHGLIVAMLLIVRSKYLPNKQLPKYKTIFAWVAESKTVLDTLPMGTTAGYAPALPRFPTELPRDVYEAAYGSGGVPAPREVQGLEAMMKHVPLRKSSELLVDEAAREAAMAKSEPPAATLTGQSAAHTVLNILADALQESGAHADDALGSRIFGARGAGGASPGGPLALKDRDAPAETTPLPLSRAGTGELAADAWTPFEPPPPRSAAVAGAAAPAVADAAGGDGEKENRDIMKQSIHIVASVLFNIL